jgi:hypothetical protein
MGYEEEPLLKPQKTEEFTKEVPVAMPVQEQLPRKWDGGLLACCGSFDLPGWATFGLVHTCPCVAVGCVKAVDVLPSCPSFSRFPSDAEAQHG